MPRLLPFVSADEVRSILARASEFIDAYNEASMEWYELSEDEQVALNEGLSASITAVEFCATTAQLLRDSSLLAPLVYAAESSENHDRHPAYHFDPLSESIEVLVGVVGRVTADVQVVAEHHLVKLREAAAGGLDPDDEASLSLLRTLATDPDPKVRRAAKKRLGPRGEMAWWQGTFAADPLTRMSEAQAKRHKKTLEELSQAIDAPNLDLRHRGNELLALAATLPPIVALDAFEMLVPRMAHATPQTLPNAPAILAKADPERLERMLRAAYKQSRQPSFEKLIGEAVASMKEAQRRATCEHFLALAMRVPAPTDDDEEGQDIWSLEAKAATIAARGWPPERDPSPLLDAALSRPDVAEGYDAVADALIGVLDTTGPHEAVLARLVDARLTGFKGIVRHSANTVSKALAKLPKKERRRLTERSLESTDDETVAWAIGELLGPLRDGRRDPPRATLVKTLWEEPRYRRAMSRHLAWACLPHLRADLRRGALGFDEAAACLAAIGEHWGGVASIRYCVDKTPDNPVWAANAAKAQLEKRREHRDLLGPRALHGVAIDAELAAWSKVRDATPIEPRVAERFFDVLDDGPTWRPEDRTYAERLIAWVRETRELRFAPRLAVCLARRPTAEDVPFLEEMFAMEREADGASGGAIPRDARDHVKAVLGLATTTEPDADEEEEDASDDDEEDETADEWA